MTTCNQHNDTREMLYNQIKAYLQKYNFARIRCAPYSMRLGNDLYGPDIQIIRYDNPYYTDMGMVGPADICVEVVCRESAGRDHGTKVDIYELASVKEYWIFDSRRREARFFRLNKSGQFVAQSVDAQQNYATPLMPDFVLHVPMLWHVTLITQRAATRNKRTSRKQFGNIAHSS